MSQQTRRLFSMRDDHVIVHTGVIKIHYEKYGTLFNDFNEVKFNSNYHNELEAKIIKAQNNMSDAFILKSQAKETSDVKGAMQELIKNLKKISFNVESAFIDNKVVLDEFRLNRISKFSKNTDTLIGFTKDVLITVERYRDELAAEGLNDTIIATTKEKLEKLDFQRREQIEKIQTRPLRTKERIDSMNVLWKHLVELRDASNFLFDEQPEIMALFALPKATSRFLEIDNVSFIESLDE